MSRPLSEWNPGTPEAPARAASELVAMLGPHPATRVGLDLDRGDDGDLGAWWTLCCLLDTRRGEPEASALAAYRELAARGPIGPRSWTQAGPERLSSWLEAAGHPRSEEVAVLLWRGARNLVDRYDGSLVQVATGCDDLEQLAAGLSGLAPGFGRAAVTRFLLPLRHAWSAAASLPLEPAARAAARHLGWLGEDEDDEAAPGILRARVGEPPDAPPWRDVEAALARLGRRACLRDRPARCPLAAGCPRRRARPATAPVPHP